MDAKSGWWLVETAAEAGIPYLYRLGDGRELPDPASRLQPDGVHGVSAIVDTSAFPWTDANFKGHALAQTIIYEIHIGTFTEEGTFQAAKKRLDLLAGLGVNAVELMPVAQFPGLRNWGYDGVYPFAVQNSYGGPDGLQQLVDAAHARGISVILDVVYNHLGPEGNYASAYAPFFTDRYRTPWGEAINFDGPLSEPVREFFIQNALYWLEEFHIDGLRLDAVHGIFDFGAKHFLAELAERVGKLASRTERKLCLMAESDLNDARLLHEPARNGYGLDAQWSDDFHHALHTLLTGETAGYYGDFGSLEDLAVVLDEGWRYSGQYSKYRKQHHGNSPVGIASSKFVVFSQNHDQIGNRAGGERLATLVDFERLKLAAGVTLLSPFVPSLFMGEEYGETHPFPYFTSHEDPGLVAAVRKGRRDEFAGFGWPQEAVPDPQAEGTFQRCKIDITVRDSEPHRTLWELYQTLIALRKRLAIGGSDPKVSYDQEHNTVTLAYRTPQPWAAVFHFGSEETRAPLHLVFPIPAPTLNSSGSVWLGACDGAAAENGAFLFGPHSFAVFEPSGAER